MNAKRIISCGLLVISLVASSSFAADRFDRLRRSAQRAGKVAVSGTKNALSHARGAVFFLAANPVVAATVAVGAACATKMCGIARVAALTGSSLTPGGMAVAAAATVGLCASCMVAGTYKYAAAEPVPEEAAAAAPAEEAQARRVSTDPARQILSMVPLAQARQILSMVPPARVRQILLMEPIEQARQILLMAPPAQAMQILLMMSLEALDQFLSTMSRDEASQFLSMMPRDEVNQLLLRMPLARAKQIYLSMGLHI